MKKYTIIFLLLAYPFALQAITMVPNPKSESEKPTDSIAIERVEGEIIYRVSVEKAYSRIYVEVAVENLSKNIVEVSSDLIHASEAKYALRYIPLDEMLDAYKERIDMAKLRYQNKEQYALANKTYTGTSTTQYNPYLNSYSTKTTVNANPNLGASLGMAVAAAQTRNEIEDAQKQAQTLINLSLAPTKLTPETICKGVVVFERKGEKGAVRIDIANGDKLLSFNFSDPPYMGVAESNNMNLANLNPRGSLALAGIKHSDTVISINGVPIKSNNELLMEARKYKVGEIVQVEFKRRMKIQTVLVTLVGPQ